MNQEQDLNLDKANGKIVFPRGRAFLLGTDVWSAMKLKQEWNIETETALKKQWVNYGRELGRRMWALVGRELDITYEVVEESASQAGWGTLKSEGDKNHGTHLTFQLRNCVFCEGLKGQFKQPCCYELTGTIQGLMEVIYGTRTVKEVRCASGPWDMCEVEVSED
jgi:predicted hydrocarbon binding protein